MVSIHFPREWSFIAQSLLSGPHTGKNKGTHTLSLGPRFGFPLAKPAAEDVFDASDERFIAKWPSSTCVLADGSVIIICHLEKHFPIKVKERLAKMIG